MSSHNYLAHYIKNNKRDDVDIVVDMLTLQMKKIYSKANIAIINIFVPIFVITIIVSITVVLNLN